MITEEQRIARKNYLGASDSSIIMGYSTYKTPYELYLEKTGIVEADNEESELQYWGNALEPAIIARFARDNKANITQPDTLYHKDHPFIAANLDGFWKEENAVLEAKMVNSFQRKQWDDAYEDGIPLAYLIQIAKQVMVANASKGYCAVLIGGMEYKQFTYQRDKELEDLILKADIDFWHCVQNKIEPPPVNISDCQKKYRADLEKSQLVTFKITNLLSELIHVKINITNHQEKEEKLKMQIMQHMGTAEYLIDEAGEILATWKATKKGNRVFNIKK